MGRQHRAVLANRGYAVPQPNRGSTVPATLNLGTASGHWRDAARIIRRSPVACRARDRILHGWGSWGQLAASRRSQERVHPELYAAAVSIVGPSSILTLLESILLPGPVRRTFGVRGDPDVLASSSAWEPVAALLSVPDRAPLLVVRCQRPAREEVRSDQIVRACGAGEGVEYGRDDEGHGFVSEELNQALFANRRVLATHLGPVSVEMPERVRRG
jgi:hypothetical protein